MAVSQAPFFVKNISNRTRAEIKLSNQYSLQFMGVILVLKTPIAIILKNLFCNSYSIKIFKDDKKSEYLGTYIRYHLGIF